MPLFKHAAEGRTINVSGAELEAQYAADTMWALVTEKPAPEIPDGDPAKEWTNPQLVAWADANDIDLGGATNKADLLKVIDAALAARTAQD